MRGCPLPHRSLHKAGRQKSDAHKPLPPAPGTAIGAERLAWRAARGCMRRVPDNTHKGRRACAVAGAPHAPGFEPRPFTRQVVSLCGNQWGCQCMLLHGNRYICPQQRPALQQPAPKTAGQQGARGGGRRPGQARRVMPCGPVQGVDPPTPHAPQQTQQQHQEGSTAADKGAPRARGPPGKGLGRGVQREWKCSQKRQLPGSCPAAWCARQSATPRCRPRGLANKG